jgi:NhaP-type Na+/H+ or K+/H+ antiporter
MIRRKTGVRRDYESIYSLGVAFAAYAAAEAVHGSGFVAAFAAGITIAALDVELCDCFLEYGQTTAEMTLLFTFVLFGSSLIWNGFAVLSWPMLIFVLAVVFVRPVVFLVSLAGTELNFRSRMLIAWFGPRGLSSLLLVLIPVFSGVPGAQTLFSICCLIVLVSVVLHGGSLVFLKRNSAATRESTLPSRSKIAAAAIAPNGAMALQDGDNHLEETISIPEMRSIQQSGAPNLVLDVRAERSFTDSDLRAEGAVRIPADRAVQRLTELNVPRQTWLFAFCA